MGYLLPPWDRNFRQRGGSSRGSVSTAVTLVWAAAERHGATSCLGPVPFPGGVCFCVAASAGGTGEGRELISPFHWVRPWCGSACSPPRHWEKRAHLWQPTATAAFKRTFSTWDSQHPWGWGQLTGLPAVSELLLRGCSSFAIPQNGISTCPEK